jgi:peptidyl-prolyl cis-trans isomerase D
MRLESSALGETIWRPFGRSHSLKISETPMLRGLRKASSNWLGKAVMALVVGFLIISFGVWGIGDIFRGFGVFTVAKVGRTEISAEQFRIRYNEQLQQFGRQIGRPITPDQARAFGLERQLLGQMIASAALDERARQLRLGISDAEVVKRITADPAFRGFNGQFDQATFLQRIRDIGFTEQRFVIEQRQTTLRRQIAEAIGAQLTPPRVVAEVMDHFRDEERSVDYVALDAAKVGEIPPPTPEQLTAYFEERKVAFRAPEYRKVQFITASQQDVAGAIEIGEEDAKRIYQDRIKLYATPERRQVTQVSFPNADEAKAASERIVGGLAFDEFAQEPGVADRLVDLGTVSKADIIDPTVANAAFELAEGAVSAPVTGRFGTVILRVQKIEPGSTKTFADVEADLRRDIALDRAKAEVNRIRDKVDEEFGGGARLEEIAKKLSMPLRTIEAVDRSGRTPAGELVADLPSGVDVVNNAFNTEIGNENDPLQLPGGGFLWYDVADITPSRERKLDEVRDRVEARFRDDEIIKRLNAKTTEIVDKLKGGAALAEVAAADGLMVDTKWGLKRQGTTILPPRVITEVFRTAKDAVGVAEGQNATERIIFRVTDIKVPTFDANSATVKGLTDQLKGSYNEDLLGQYLARLESDLGTNINQAALDQAVGRTSNPSNTPF